MALPSDVDESYLLSCPDELKAFWRTVQRRAPESVQSRVSEFRSEVSTAKCIFRDRDGVVLYETPDAPSPVSETYTPAPRAADTTITNRLQKDVQSARKLGLSNADAVVQLAEVVTTLADRVNRLQDDLALVLARTEGMQKALDITRKAALSYSGEWQSALPYQPGALVKHNGAMYAALKDIKAGGNLRDGSGWEKLV